MWPPYRPALPQDAWRRLFCRVDPLAKAVELLRQVGRDGGDARGDRVEQQVQHRLRRPALERGGTVAIQRILCNLTAQRRRRRTAAGGGGRGAADGGGAMTQRTAPKRGKIEVAGCARMLIKEGDCSAVVVRRWAGGTKEEP